MEAQNQAKDFTMDGSAYVSGDGGLHKKADQDARLRHASALHLPSDCSDTLDPPYKEEYRHLTSKFQK